MRHITRRHNQQGFTILELMIATVVLSVILLIATLTIFGVGKLYYKGQTTAQTQDTARNVIEQISRQLQFSGDKPNLLNTAPGNSCALSMWCASWAAPGGSATVYAYCIGSTRYSFVLNREEIPLTDSLTATATNATPTYHALWQDTMLPGTATCNPVNVLTKTPADAVTVAGTGKGLLLPNMRLVGFGLTQNPSTSVYDITLNVNYGDDDLLASAQGSFPTQYRYCNTTVGDQFCAVSNIHTSAVRRLR